MPIGAFVRCLRGELKYAAKTKRYALRGCLLAWESLYDEYLKFREHPPEYLHYLRKKRQALDAYAKVLNGEDSMEVVANMYLHESEALIAGDGDKIEVICASLSKSLGFAVRANECVVTEFYGYIDYVKSWQKND